VIWNVSSSAIINSTRSSDESPSSSIVVSGASVRPGANRASTLATDFPADDPAARPSSRADSRPVSHARSSRRFSFRVPSVRGSSFPGQIAAARIF
jgi:hypothetical protein